MISIVVCSVNPQLAQNTRQNIEDTIGIPYQLVVIDNRNSSKGIAQVYNEGASQSHFPYLCFIHEDIIIKTMSWGKLITGHFTKLANPGILGLAGAIYKPKALSSWWQEPEDGIEPKRCRLQQHFKYNPFHPNYTYFNPLNESTAEVVSLDGMFLAMTKETWMEHPFDEKMLHGFHGYDLDICLSVGKSKKNYTVFDILVEHLSEGRNDVHWLLDNLKVHRKHSAGLPVVVDQYRNVMGDFKKTNHYWEHYWLDQMVVWGIGPSQLKMLYIEILKFSGAENENINANILMAYTKFYALQLNSTSRKVISKAERGFKKLYRIITKP